MHTLTRDGLSRRSQNFVDVALGAHRGRIAELHNSPGHLAITPSDHSGLPIR
ncbi:hypothetical protein ACWD3J_16430 [Streptomyces sp. NPDC002755]